MALSSYQRIANGDVDPESPVTTSLVTLLRDNPISMLVQAPSAPDMMLRHDPTVMNHGLGTTSLLWNSSRDIEAPITECNTLNITGGAGIVISFKRPFHIIRAVESIYINATMNHNYLTIAVPEGNSKGNAGSGAGGGGGGGGWTNNTYLPTAGVDGDGSQFGGVAGGAGGVIGTPSTDGGDGGDGASLTVSTVLDLMNLLSYYESGGANGNVGGEGSWSFSTGVVTPAPGGEGGVSGGLLILVAPSIILDTACSFNMQGQNGFDGLDVGSDLDRGGSGGGGGGGGGSLLAISQGVNSFVDNAAPNNFSGGVGGAAGTNPIVWRDGGAGGDGGAGRLLNIELDRADEL